MDFLLSIIYTLAVTLLPYIITFFITKKKQLTLKTTKILTIIFSIISFAVFCVIGFLSGQSGISVVPVVIWNGIGYLIIRKNIKQSNNTEDTEPAATCNEETDINSNETAALPGEKISTGKSNKIKVKIKKTVECNEKPKKSKKRLSTIILSVTTILFIASTIGLTVELINQQSNNQKFTSQIETLKSTIKQKDDTISHLNTEIINQKGTISNLESKLYFYDTCAVCVNDNSSYYHKPDCIYFDNSGFYIYNTETAKVKGYRKCPYCF